MQAPFLCLISFLERCRYLSINCILTRLATGPGEYVPMPFIKGMVNRRSVRYSSFIPDHFIYHGVWFTEHSPLLSQLRWKSQNLLLMCHHSLPSHTAHPPPPPQAMMLYCSWSQNHPDEAFQYINNLDDRNFVWCEIYCFSLSADICQLDMCQV